MLLLHAQLHLYVGAWNGCLILSHRVHPGRSVPLHHALSYDHHRRGCVICKDMCTRSDHMHVREVQHSVTAPETGSPPAVCQFPLVICHISSRYHDYF